MGNNAISVNIDIFVGAGLGVSETTNLLGTVHKTKTSNRH